MPIVYTNGTALGAPGRDKFVSNHQRVSHSSFSETTPLGNILTITFDKVSVNNDRFTHTFYTHCLDVCMIEFTNNVHTPHHMTTTRVLFGVKLLSKAILTNMTLEDGTRQWNYPKYIIVIYAVNFSPSYVVSFAMHCALGKFNSNLAKSRPSGISMNICTEHGSGIAVLCVNFRTGNRQRHALTPQGPMTHTCVSLSNHHCSYHG